ncbi:hypothetical protein [Arcticibacter sp.]|uniref:hypothetical protein n=1 Tax=Arcticibacter sp. TaxID=1872630 RepID=UPI00388E9D0E
MKKISTLFKKDPNDLGRVVNEFNEENLWVFNPGVKITRKWDGTACAIINGELYKRYDVKKGKVVPENAIPCQEPDEITGHWPHWIKCDRLDNGSKWHFEAFDYAPGLHDGTYELCGPKIQGNPEKLSNHYLIAHGKDVIALSQEAEITFDRIKLYLENNDVEGIVFHEPLTGKMCKIRKSDFGIKR